MFKNMTAWFSSSVDNVTKQSWRNNGGSETDFDTAQFIFSSDNSCPDTERVFNSSAYISDHLAVFHSQYILDRIKASDEPDVVLGNYFLPPQEIADMVRKQMSFCWDVPSSDAQPSQPPPARQPNRTASPHKQHPHAASRQEASAANVQPHPAPTASSPRLHDLRSSPRHRPDSCKAASTQSQRSSSPTSMRALSNRPDLCSAESRQSQVYQAAAVFHISELKKVRASELTEFLPGQHGAVLLRKEVGFSK